MEPGIQSLAFLSRRNQATERNRVAHLLQQPDRFVVGRPSSSGEAGQRGAQDEDGETSHSDSTSTLTMASGSRVFPLSDWRYLAARCRWRRREPGGRRLGNARRNRTDGSAANEGQPGLELPVGDGCDGGKHLAQRMV